MDEISYIDDDDILKATRRLGANEVNVEVLDSLKPRSHYNCVLHLKRNGGFFCEDLTECIDGALYVMVKRIKSFKGLNASKEETDDSGSSENDEL